MNTWRELLNTRYGVSGRNTVINQNINDLRHMQHRIDDKIYNIRADRQHDLNILTKEMSARVYQIQTELNDMKKEIEDNMKAINEKKTRDGYLRKNKRKYDMLT